MPKTTYAPFHNRLAWICRSPGVAEHSYTSAKATDDLAAYQEANDIKRKSLATVYAVRQTIMEMDIADKLLTHGFPKHNLMWRIRNKSPWLANYMKRRA